MSKWAVHTAGEGDYLIPNLALPDTTGNYQIGKYGRMRRTYLKEHRKMLYTTLVVEGTLFEHLAEIDQSCNKRMEIIVFAMAKQEGVTEVLKAADQREWVADMKCKVIILSPALPYHPKKKSPSAFGDSGICGISGSINVCSIPIF